jgi:hypothetical protein
MMPVFATTPLSMTNPSLRPAVSTSSLNFNQEARARECLQKQRKVDNRLDRLTLFRK